MQINFSRPTIHYFEGGTGGGTDPPLETGVGVWSPPWQKKIVPPLRVKKD